jgi:hypothetical protein
VLLEQVANALGCPDSLRRADGIALRTTGRGWHLEVLEVKLTPEDVVRQLKQPAKIAPFALFCACIWIVVRAPRKNTIPDALLAKVPEMWGIYEVGTGPIVVVRPAIVRRNVEEPTPEFLRAMFRAQCADVRRELRGEGDAPLRAIGGRISREFVWLDGCLHKALMPLAKRDEGAPTSIPCFSCLADLPADEEAVAAALEAADPRALLRHRDRIDRLLGVTDALAAVAADEPAAAEGRAA